MPPHISLRFVGFGARSSGSRVETRCVPQGTTLKELCESVGAPVDDHGWLAPSDLGPVSIVLNGKLVRRATDLQTVVEEQDVVSFIVLGAGG
jgi:molybdopterin converting factor small subunit